jgi:hydrogenase expression/formation protein HypC
MCLALPARIEELTAPGNDIVNLGGVRKEISLALVEDVAAGDYVIVHVGYALQKLDQDEAEHTLALFARMSQMNYLSEMNDAAVTNDLPDATAA